MSSLTEVGRLIRVVVKHARDAFVSQIVIDAEWKWLNFSGPPNFSRAVAEYDRFLEIIAGSGAEIWEAPKNERLTLDSIYVRDASIVCGEGSVLCSMGKPARAAEPDEQDLQLRRMDWPVAGRIASPGLLEGGDLIWLDPQTIAVGEGARTNAEGIRQLRALSSNAEILVVKLPDWHGPQDVMHLMSLVSPVDTNLAVVYSRLMPSSFREELLLRDYQLIDVPDEEFETMGTNVLALAPRVCVMVEGNPKTRAMLERAGAMVFEYKGEEISLKGGGGPTCLTRPLVRSA